MKKTMPIILCLTFFMLFASCSKDQEVVENAITSTEAMRLAHEADLKTEEIQKKIILSASPAQDKNGLTTIIQNLKFGLLLLAQNMGNHDALDLLYDNLKQFNLYQISKIDRSQLEPFITQIYTLLTEAAKIQGRELAGLSWTMFSYTFSTGVWPFETFTNNANWTTYWQLDRPLIKVKGQDVKAWLITPSFDLTAIQKPSFRFLHLFDIERNNNSAASDDFDLPTILRSAFKVYVSTNYEDGADPNDPKWNWKSVDFTPYPSGSDFHSVVTPQIDLSSFIGHNVSIAFCFDMNSKAIGKHYITWQIERFDLMGVGIEEQFAPKMRKKSFQEMGKIQYSKSFNASVIDPFTKVSYIPGVDWITSGFKAGAYDFIKAQASSKDADTWAISPRLTLSANGTYVLQLTENVRNPKWDNFQVLISDNFKGGDPKKATWDLLDTTPQISIKPDVWVNKLASKQVDITPYAGRDVAIAFRYLASKDQLDGGTWQILSMDIRGHGPSIEVTPFEVTP